MHHDILPAFRISIEPDHFKILKNNIWNEKHLPSKLMLDNNCYQIGITYRGDHIRKFAKKSYSINFGEYNKDFEGREIHLNAEYRDPSLIRNKLSFDFFQTIGSISPESKHVFLELNGKPKGIYLLLESVDDLFLQKRQLPYGPIFYATIYHANFSLLTPRDNPKPCLRSGYEQKIGTEDDNRDLEMLIYKVNTIPRSDFGQEIIKYVDIRKYLLWLCGVVCTQNFDGFIHNYALYQNGETKLYEMIPWDYDATWGRDWNGKIMEYNYVPIEGYNTLTARLLDVKDIRNQYRLLLEEILEMSFTVAALEPRIINLHKQLSPYLSLDPYKKKSVKLFDSEPDFILRFISDRNIFLKRHLKDLV